MEKNFYDILGITDEERNLSETDFDKVLKTKYKKLAREWHPDKFATKSEEEKRTAEERFKEISEAYNTLSDSTKRQQYDFQTSGGGYDDMDPFASIFRNMHSNGFGFGGPRTVKGQNVQVQVDITIEESYNGGETEVEYDVLKTCRKCNGTGSANGVVESCPHCNGTGMIVDRIQRGNMLQMASRLCPHCNGTGKKITTPCPHCSGKGMENITEKEKVTIPRGVVTGQYYVLNGKGCEAPSTKGSSAINGDLIIIFNVIEGEYQRDGDNLVKELKISVFDALLGCDVKVTSIDKKEININVPECTKNGHVFVIKGKGMPNMHNPNVIGDLKLVVKYEIPTSLSNKDRELLKKLKR
jgi:molecular chaperone DnaJ